MRKVDVHYTLLLDYYGALLPKKQYDVAALYYNDDLSLSEIADELGITRQGVLDGLSRAESSLAGFDKALSLIERDKVTSAALQSIRTEVGLLRGTTDTDALDRIIAACDTVALKG